MYGQYTNYGNVQQLTQLASNLYSSAHGYSAKSWSVTKRRLLKSPVNLRASAWGGAMKAAPLSQELAVLRSIAFAH